MNFSTVSNLWRVFKAGEQVADPSVWKAHQVTVNQVAAVLAAAIALMKGLGHDPHLDDPTVVYLAGGIYAVVNWLLTVATTRKIGIFGQRADDGSAGLAGQPGDAAERQDAHATAADSGGPAIAPAPAPVRPSPAAAPPDDPYLRG